MSGEEKSQVNTPIATENSFEAIVTVETDPNIIREHANDSIAHNLEVQAVDYLIENNSIQLLCELPSLEKNNIRKLCSYLLRVATFIDDDQTKLDILKTSYILYMNFEYYFESMIVALKLNDDDKIKRTYTMCTDNLTKKQLSVLLAKHKYYKIKEDEYLPLLRNYELSSLYIQIAECLKAIPPKTPQELYKLEKDKIRAMPFHYANDCIVNAFVNAGYCSDRFSLISSDATYADVPTNKSLSILDKFEAAAGLGSIYMWNTYEGLNTISPLLRSSDNVVKTGAVLAVGLCCSQIYNEEEDLPLNLLHSYLTAIPTVNSTSEDKDLYCTALLSIAMAYMATNRYDIVELILPALEIDIPEIVACAMLAISLIYVGNPEIEVASSLLQIAGTISEGQFNDIAGVMTGLALGLLFMNSTSQYEDLFLPLITSFSLPELYNSYLCICVRSLCYIGSGDLNIIQEFMHILSEHIAQEDKALAQKACLFGIVFVCMNEPLSTKMVYRQLELILTLSESPITSLVPIAFALLSPSSLNQSLLDIILRKSASIERKGAAPEAKPALFALGLLSAGSNSSKVGNHLRNLMNEYIKNGFDVCDIKHTFALLYMGKGLLSLSPSHTDHQLLTASSLACLLIPSFYHICKDKQKPFYESLFFYLLVGAAQPSCAVLLDGNNHLHKGLVRLGQAVDITGVAGNPRPISGFDTNEAPVLMDSEQRAILVDNQGIESICQYLEGICYIKEVPIETVPKK